MWLLDRNTLSRTLVGESEAFLIGQLAEQIDRNGERVPVWAWTNLLAHGSAADLETERQVPYIRVNTPGERWRAARSYLAEEVSDLAEGDEPLVEIQRKVLVPLELELASRNEVDWWGTGQWVNAVRERLAEHQRVRERVKLRARPSPGRADCFSSTRTRDIVGGVR